MTEQFPFSRKALITIRNDAYVPPAEADDAYRALVRLSRALDEERAELVAAGLEYVYGHMDGRLARMTVPVRPPVPGDGVASYSDYMAQTRDQERRDRQRFTGAD